MLHTWQNAKCWGEVLYFSDQLDSCDFEEVVYSSCWVVLRRILTGECSRGALTMQCTNDYHQAVCRDCWKTEFTLPETNIAHENPIFPGKYHQNGGFSMAMLVSGRVSSCSAHHDVCDGEEFRRCLWCESRCEMGQTVHDHAVLLSSCGTWAWALFRNYDRWAEEHHCFGTFKIFKRGTWRIASIEGSGAVENALMEMLPNTIVQAERKSLLQPLKILIFPGEYWIPSKWLIFHGYVSLQECIVVYPNNKGRRRGSGPYIHIFGCASLLFFHTIPLNHGNMHGWRSWKDTWTLDIQTPAEKGCLDV